MDNTPGSSQECSAELPLPTHFESIQSILDIENKRLDTQPMVNIIGLVRDFQPPTETRGTDWKCTLNIIDLSTQEGPGIRINLFYPRDRMPSISAAGDAMLIRRVKVQMHRGLISLLGNWNTELNVFTGLKLPLWPLKSPAAVSGAVTSKNRLPSLVEANYLVWLYHHIEKGNLPTALEFEQKSFQAISRKEKYSLCKDLESDRFYDLIGEAIRIFDSGGKITLYFSDYTAHPLFHQYVWNGGSNRNSGGREGDEYGYIRSRTKVTTDWPGPFGKMSIQITIFSEIDANLVREQVRANDWIYLKNVHTKIGPSGCIEGKIHEDTKYEDKTHVDIIRKAQDPKLNDPRWKEALRRKKQWWTKFNKQKQDFLEDAEASSMGKRKSVKIGSSEQNSKKRRRHKQAAAMQSIAAGEGKIVKGLDLNQNVRCNHPEIEPIPLQKIIDHKQDTYKLASGQEQSVPFVNAKYRSCVRVVDFWPHKLEDFTVSRRESVYEVLSDYSGGESTDNEEDMKRFREGKGFGGARTWEWRFALQVEDAAKKATSAAERMWLLVDHHSAQMLLGVDDAKSLRADEDALTVLKETLFKLWGELEERKTEFLKTPRGKALRWASMTSDRLIESESEPDFPTPLHKALEQPPPDSDDETPNEQTIMTKTTCKRTALGNRDPNADSSVANIKTLTMSQASEQLSSAIWALPVAGKGFTCCIRQYGVEVREDSADKADAGEDKRWQRMFAMFGTQII